MLFRPPKFTVEQLRAELHYTPETGVWTRLVARCNRVKIGDIAGCPDSYGYTRIRVFGDAYTSSRLAWFYMKGEWPPCDLEHADDCPGHDWWSNLRLATREQNQMNRRARHDNRLGKKNISFRKDMNKYRLRMSVDQKRVTVGHFDTWEEARVVYEERVKIHGEFGRVE